MLDKYDIVIGLEIHAELNTKSKVFCKCANNYGSEPNTNCCPICLGFPGSLPNLNREAVRKTMLAGLAMNCAINDVAVFERKNYFYPDISKSYQISQLEKPICLGGHITLKSGKKIRLNRIHLEEDAAKLIHDDANGRTQIDYNRGGLALIEMVTEPDISSALEAVEFLEEIRSRLVFSGVAECKMEQGGMRCDVNLSLKPKNSKTYGNRTEMKNLNSFKMVARAIEYEANRQASVLDEGGTIEVETRKWVDASGKSVAMRSKENAADYRYFPDPDIYSINISRADVEKVKNEMPVLAHTLREKLISKFGLPQYDAEILTKSKIIAEFFLECNSLIAKPKAIANWILTDVLKRMKDTDSEEIPVSAKTLSQIIKMVEDGTITKTVGLDMLDGKVALTDISGVTDEEITKILTRVKDENPSLATDYVANPQKVLPFIIGQVMKATRGKAKSDAVTRIAEQLFKK